MTTKRSLRLVLATLALPLFWAGCFASPDYTKITCQTDKQCAPGYQCNLTTKKCILAVDASSLAEAGGSHVDGSFDVGAGADLSVAMDSGSAERVGVDTIGTVDSAAGMETGALADSQISVDVALPDAPGGFDVASPDVASPDLPTDLPVDLPIGRDVPVAGDAGIDGTAVVVDTRPAGAPLGAACVTSSDCALGNCVDSVCCDSPCTGSCQSCALPTSPGTCSNVTGAPAPSHTPCAGSGICAGTCNGQSASCAYHGAETNCGAASCTSGMATDARSCNGAGSCSSLSTHPCGAFICGATACLTSCTDNSQCVSGDACVSGQCTACSTGLTVCPNLCVNLQTSNAHCGACSGTGSVCSANQQCAGGKCLSVDGQSCSNNTQCVSGICNTFYQDGDGDGYPVTSPSVGYCNASTSPVSGYIPARSDGKWDCCDSDPSVKPGQSAFFTSPSLTCIPNSGGWDYDCSGGIEKQPEAHVGDTCTADTATTCLLTTADGIPTEDCGQSYGYPFLCSLRGICGWANFAADVGLVACH